MKKTAYISKGKAGSAQSIFGQDANSIGKKIQASGKLQQNMTKHILNMINTYLFEIKENKVTY